MRDAYHSSKAVQAIAPAVKSAAEYGDAIDLKGFESALFVITTGAVAGSGNFGVVIGEGDTNASDYHDAVAAADLIGDTLPATLEAEKTYRLAYIGKQRFVSVSLTKASGTSIALAAVAVLGHPHVAPTA